MKKNLGNVDKIVRVILALVIGYLYYTGVISGTLGIVLMVLAVVFLATSLINWCPIYHVLGISTNKSK